MAVAGSQSTADETKAELVRPKPVLMIVALIVFIDMIGMGLVAPVMPALITDISELDLHKAAEMGGYLMFAYAVMQFACAPLLGALSDRFGRRPILLATLLALGLNYWVMALASNLALLFVGRIVSGALGATWAAANSCIADFVTPAKRGAAFGMLAGAGAVGYVLGPAIGGIAGEIGTRWPFVIAGILAVLAAVMGYTLLPETLAPAKRRSLDLARANPVSTLQHFAHQAALRKCLLVVFFLQLSAQAHLSIWAFYGTEKFQWTPLMAGISVSFYGVVLALTQAILTGPAVTKFGALQTAKLGIVFAIPSYLLLAFAPNTPVVFLAVMIGCVTGMTFPALQSFMTANVDEASQGKLQGVIVSTIGLTAIIGPVTMTHVFAFFAHDQAHYFPGAPFILSTLFICVAGTILWRLAKSVTSA
jgi:MFS transporter, DHA1 family, tetracycline resistance protein